MQNESIALLTQRSALSIVARENCHAFRFWYAFRDWHRGICVSGTEGELQTIDLQAY